MIIIPLIKGLGQRSQRVFSAISAVKAFHLPAWKPHCERGGTCSRSIIPTMKLPLIVLALLTVASTQTPDPHSIPSVDAGVSTCSADFTITDTDNKPVYAAKVKVHIAYGFASVRKLDLEVSTNIDGKARFTGLPDRLKRGLLFEASEGDRTGNAFDDVNKTCQAQFAVTLRKPTTAAQ